MEITAKFGQLKVKKRSLSLPQVKLRSLGGAIVVLSSAFLFTWRLSALTLTKVSASELATKHQLYLNSPWWTSSAHLYGPYYLLLHGTYAISRNTWSLRLASVIAGFMCVVLIYWAASFWHSYKIGILAGGVALSNFGLLSAGRDAVPLITQPLLVISLVAVLIAIHDRADIFGLVLLLIAAVFGLYVPGGIWLVLVTLILSWSVLKQTWSEQSFKIKSLLSLVAAVLAAPLAYALIARYSASQLESWLGYGLRGHLLDCLKAFGLNFAHTPLDLFFRSSGLSANIGLGHLPLLPIAISLLVAFGLYSYLTRLSNWRWRAVITLLAVSWFLSGLGQISPLALIPLLIISAATGLAYLLKRWYQVFPRNPIARPLGLIIMVAVVIFCCYYSARSYFVGWGNNERVQANYDRSLN